MYLSFLYYIIGAMKRFWEKDNRMKHSTIRTIPIFLLIFNMGFFFIFSAATSNALSSGDLSGQKIRVAQIDLSNFLSYDRNGLIESYGYEYLAEISKHTGWKYEYIPVTWEQGLMMLESGEVDLLAPAPADPELQKRFDFSEREIGMSYSVLCVAAEDTKTPINDYPAFNGMLVGVLEDDAAYKKLESFAQKKEFFIKTVLFDNPAALRNALHNGRINAILVNSLQIRPTERVVAWFNPTPFYFMAEKGNQDIMSSLNAALGSIKESNPYYDFELQKKYYDWVSSDSPFFQSGGRKLTDYPLSLIFLGLLLSGAIFIALTVAVKRHHNNEIRKAAYLDNVTGTWNYDKFKIDAHAILKSARNKKYAIAYMDIHKFSYINDTFGYSAGDLILSEVAGELARMTKDTGCSARISADNFVCLLEYKTENEIAERGRDFQKGCDERLSRINSRYKVEFTCSVYKVLHGETDIPSLVGKADIAHKTIGDSHISSVVFYDKKIEREYLRKKKLESTMKSSLEHGDFLVYLQPKVDLSSGRIVGTEALARWQHPTEGLIMPAHFISLFESNGFILELDFYIYEKVCQMIRKWIDAGETVLPVSVNVSKAHLANHEFGNQLKALIDQYQISPELLELELTESILFDSREADLMIRNLKNLGFSILIDDFGSGFSSLNLLKDLTVDILKLDKEFFRIGGMEEKDKIIVDGIIRIANDLNLKILSEGVENQEQVDFLIAAGCHMAQGYYFARPMPVEVFEEMVEYEISSHNSNREL